MGMAEILSCLLLLFTPSLATSDQIFPSCLSSNVTWDQSLIIDTIPNTPTPEHCQQLCQLDNNCVAITWIIETNAMFPNLCALFSATSQDLPCPECVSGPAHCSCSIKGECRNTDENIIDIFHGVNSEESCHAMCEFTSDCMFYTFFAEDHPLHHVCFIFTTCEEVDDTCDQCLTGPRDCETCDYGQVIADGVCTDPTACKEGWTEYEKRCYKLFTGEITRDTYRSICQSSGGELASIHSLEENTFILRILRHGALATWIGGFDCVYGGECKWTDGSDWSWTNWHSGHPEGRDCLLMGYEHTGYSLDEWVDGVCYQNNVDSICKI